MSWLTKSRPAYALLIPDLNGLIGPLLDPGQSLLEASVENHREWGEGMQIYCDYHHDSVTNYRSDADNRWTAAAQWRLGLPRAWALQLATSRDWPYDTRWKSERLLPAPPVGSYGEGRVIEQYSAQAELNRRWGQWVQVGVGGTANWWGHSYFMDQIRSAYVSAVAVSSPSRAGAPLGKNLDGFLAPLLDCGQVRWDGKLSAEWWMTSQAWWQLDNSVAVGVARPLQLEGRLTLSPDFSFGYGPRGDVRSHFQAGIAAVYRPSNPVQIRFAYLYGYDRSSGDHITDTSLFHMFRLTASVLW